MGGTGQTVVGLIGNIISICLSLAPVPTMLDIRRNQSADGYSAKFYLAAMLNCAVWVVYGLVQADGVAWLVVSVNSVGLLVQFVYVLWVLYYSSDEVRGELIYILIPGMLGSVFGGIVLYNLVQIPSLWFGGLGACTGSVMYIMPLVVTYEAIADGSLDSSSILIVCVVALVNSTVWFIYGIIASDTFVMIPNIVGLASGVWQLRLYFMHRNDN